MPVNLSTIVGDFALGLREVDARRPTAINLRSKVPFRPGIGPHTEAATVALVMAELAAASPEKYREHRLGVPYPNAPRQKVDLCIGMPPEWDWAIEVKLLRFLGDNGQPNDNMLMHILSPYPEHRSALTDCRKMLSTRLARENAIVIYGFESETWPLEPAIEAFEALARARVRLGGRNEASFEGLVHPIHTHGRVFGWWLDG